MTRRLVLLGVALALLAALVWWALSSAGTEVVRPSTQEVVELVIASGRLRPVRQSEIGSSVPGTVAEVLVDEGDLVTEGQLLVQLEDADLRAQRAQARNAVGTATSQLAQVERGAQPEEIARARAELEQADRVNQARVQQARQRLEQLENGGRPEELREAMANLDRARSSRAQAERDLARARTLFAQDAVPRTELEQAELAHSQALSAEQAQEASLRLVRRPARVEEIAAARQELAAAEATYSTGVAVARESLGLLERKPYPEDLSLARARLAEAESAYQNAVEQTERRALRAPMAGLITRREVEPGQSVNPGAALLTLAAMDRTEIYVETDETNLPRLRVGQEAQVYPPAYREQPFAARVKQIGPDVDATRGVVAVRLQPLKLPDYARPDMTLDVNIEVKRLKALSLPLTSLITRDGTDLCLVVEDGRARERPLRVLARGENWAAVEGVTEGDEVVLRATSVEPEARVRTRLVESPPARSGPPAEGRTDYVPVTSE